MRTVIRNSYSPQLGDYCNTVVVDRESGVKYIFDADGVYTKFTYGKTITSLEDYREKYKDTDVFSTGPVKEKFDELDGEIENLHETDADLQQQIDDVRDHTDVVDIVPTFAALEAYDTSELGDNDIIKVLVDETHDDASTYWRWNKPANAWQYIGEQPAAVAATHVYLKRVNSTRYQTYADDGLTVAISALDLYAASQEGQVVFHYTNGAYDYVYVVGNASKQTLSGTPTLYRIHFNTIGFLNGTNNPSATNFTSNPYNSDGTGNTFDVEMQQIQKRLTAGSGITIDGTTISAAGATVYYAEYTDLSSTRLTLHETDLYGPAVMTTDFIAAAATGPVVIDFVDDMHGVNFYAIVTNSNGPDHMTPFGDGWVMTFEIHTGSNVIQYAYSDSQGFGNWEKITEKPNLYSAGANIAIDSAGVISATNTTYSDMAGATSSAAGVHGLVPAPAAGDQDKYLKGDGTWGAADSALDFDSTNAIQNQAVKNALYEQGTGADLGKEKAIDIRYDDPTTDPYINIGSNNTTARGAASITIGDEAYAYSTGSIAIGDETHGFGNGSITIGASARGALSGSGGVIIGQSASLGGGADSVIIGHSAGTGTSSPDSVAIGHSASALQTDAIAIGHGAKGGSSSSYGSYAISIGTDAATTGNHCIAIGDNAKTLYGTSEYGVAIGAHTQTSGGRNVAIGSYSITSEANTVSFGNESLATPLYRRIINIADAVNPHDAVTKSQLDTAVGNIETILQTLNSGNGAQ